MQVAGSALGRKVFLALVSTSPTATKIDAIALTLHLRCSRNENGRLWAPVSY